VVSLPLHPPATKAKAPEELDQITGMVTAPAHEFQVIGPFRVADRAGTEEETPKISPPAAVFFGYNGTTGPLPGRQ
jgi:hypothetical protein